MKIIGLTGPIGAGKDAVAKLLKRRGAFIIDADKVARELYVFQSPVWRELVKAFGVKILMRGGKVNRNKLAELVFSDKRKLQQLDRIVHPCLKEKIIEMIEDQRPLIVINAAVLKEIGLLDHVDEVWVVTAPKELRLKRLIKKGMPKPEALKRINAQISKKEYLKMADVIINNERTLKQLNAKVQACLKF